MSDQRRAAPVRLVTRAEAAVLLGCSERALRRWMGVEQGWPDPVKHGPGRLLHYSLVDLHAAFERLHPAYQIAPEVRPWAADELVLLADASLSNRAVAERVGRTEAAVKGARAARGLQRRLVPSRPEWLVARTCHACDELLGRDDYTIRVQRDGRSRSYPWVCGRCDGERAKAVRDEAYQDSLLRADRHGQQWTGAEVEILDREDLTHRQAAELLGRTVRAVEAMRGRLRRGDEWASAFRSSRR